MVKSIIVNPATLQVSMLFAQAEPMARKDHGSNYILVQWIKVGIMVGVCHGYSLETRQKYLSFCWNSHFTISLSLWGVD